MKCLTYTNADGGLSIVHPVARDGETEAETLARVAARSVPPGVAYSIVDVGSLPARRFRGAWRHGGGRIRVDVSAAREIVLAETRKERSARLAATDAEKSRLDDVGTDDERRELAAKRKTLRDLPAKVSAEIAAMSIAELEQYTPWK